MSFKTIFIITLSVLITVILMNNTDDINFWFFGEIRIQKLTVLGSMFGLGVLVGLLLGRPGKKPKTELQDLSAKTQSTPPDDPESTESLSEEDRDYIR
jgi:hypothetical protein